MFQALKVDSFISFTLPLLDQQEEGISPLLFFEAVTRFARFLRTRVYINLQHCSNDQVLASRFKAIDLSFLV